MSSLKMFPTSILVASAACFFSFNARQVLGLSVTSPEEGFLWDTVEPLKVQWSSVSSDPESFNIQISNQDTNTFPSGFTETLKKDVKTSEGAATVAASGISGLKAGSGYRVNLVSSTTDNAGILAQSQTFNVTTVSTTSAHPDSNTTTSSGMNTTHADTLHSSTNSSGVHDIPGASTHPSSSDSSSATKDASHNDCNLLQPGQLSAILGAAAVISAIFA